MENFRPGVLDRLGFSPAQLHELNPRLVILSISGFGHDGPEATRSGYDQIVQGEAGLMSLTGSGPEDPQRVGVPIADLLSGMYGAFGAAGGAAGTRAHRQGPGGAHLAAGRRRRRPCLPGHPAHGRRARSPAAQGNHHPSIAPYGLFACRGGKVQISVGSEKLWETFAAAFGIDAARPEFAAQRASGSRNRQR